MFEEGYKVTRVGRDALLKIDPVVPWINAVNFWEKLGSSIFFVVLSINFYSFFTDKDGTCYEGRKNFNTFDVN